MMKKPIKTALSSDPVFDNQYYIQMLKKAVSSQAYSPEIFILPGTHDAFARPAENATNTIIQTHGFTTGKLLLTI